TCIGHGRDSYGRLLGVCAAGGVELNRAMVRQGLAWAFIKYSSSYVAEERAAKSDRLGVWQSDCKPAWEYREARWSTGASAAPRGCAIKGNITNRGRHVYHMPWSPWYTRTKIELSKGERWFCSEAEAIRAGWEPSRS
ncbi:MAG TPA: thermonuclease family protein, partial [Hyphomicrobiaceae bacterium]|nr:thermonuclease family protein [Hyphomicrobiaceae bacterium]